jgi:predicted ester cyclase
VGIPPTGKAVTLSRIDIWRVENGKLAEHWDSFDLHDLLTQLGAIPAPA